MKARDVMISPVLPVTPHTLLREILRLLEKNRIKGVPIVAAEALPFAG